MKIFLFRIFCILLSLLVKRKSILFVCTGNTCRSPMAEGYLRWLTGRLFIVKSAGTSAGNSQISDNSVAAMSEIGIDISKHKSRSVAKELGETVDVIFTMSASHMRQVGELFPNDQFYVPIRTLKFCDDISDPYGGDLERYRICRDEIVDAIIELVKKLVIPEINCSFSIKRRLAI